MIIVHVEIEASEEAIAMLREPLAKLETATRAEEGCIEYTFCSEVNNPGVIRVIECWESKEALGAHFHAPHMAEFQAVMKENPQGEMKLKMFEASETSMG